MHEPFNLRLRVLPIMVNYERIDTEPQRLVVNPARKELITPYL